MKNLERDKLLTEKLGFCWHENLPYRHEGTSVAGYFCKDCNTLFQGITKEYALKNAEKKNPNFSEWNSFGKLWDFATKQKWWNDFLIQSKLAYKDYEQSERFMRYTSKVFSIVNPDKFADKLYDYLKDK